MEEKESNIIKEEAFSFIANSIDIEGNEEAIENFRQIKRRLDDFYSPEAKSIFLDRVKDYINKRLNYYRDNHSERKVVNDYFYEAKVRKLLFYIKQEMGTLPLVAHQKNISNYEKRELVFVSYSKYDKEPYLTEIRKHFKPFLKNIEFWDDSKILPGQKWREEVKLAISNTKVAILLISADFLASDFISSEELPPILKLAEEQGAVILNVILRPCLFEEFDELNQFQAMNSPSNPVIKMNQTEREELYSNLVRQTKKILEGKKN